MRVEIRMYRCYIIDSNQSDMQIYNTGYNYKVMLYIIYNQISIISNKTIMMYIYKCMFPLVYLYIYINI